MKFIILYLFVYLFTFPLQAQTTLIQDNILDSKMENITESTENENLDYTALFEKLRYHQSHPVNLNATSKEELEEIQLLDDILIDRLLTHIQDNGKLLNVYELQSIEGFTPDVINKILPYIKVAETSDLPKFSLNSILKAGESQFISRYQQVLEKQKGFLIGDNLTKTKKSNLYFLGSSPKIYARYKFNYLKNVSIGFTAEKDEGEQFFKGSQAQGFDFYSAHIYLKNIGTLKALAIGDYHVSFGQGLMGWAGLALGKSNDVINIKKMADGIRPHTSVDENLFMRGIASTLAYKKFQFTGFFSRKKIDGNLINTDITNAESIEVSSLQQTGFHRILSEIDDKHAISQMIYGGNIAYKNRRLNIGLTAMKSSYGGYLNRTLSLYNQFESLGNSNANVGGDYSFVFQNFNFFGEAAISQNGGKAFIDGVLLSVDPRLSFSILYRNYQKNYQGINSHAISENTKPANEIGIYTGIVAKPFSLLTINAYCDRFIFPWLKYQTNAPSYGSDYSLQINYTPSKTVDMYFRMRQRDKFKNTTETLSDIDYLVGTEQMNYRFHISYAVTSSIVLKNRVEFIRYKIGDNRPENGYLAYQDVIYKMPNHPFSFSFRYALFETDTYNSRIYAYENDVLYAFSIPSYYFRGSRTYLMLNYNVTKKIELWLRYGQTFYSNKDLISSGLTEIKGSTKSEVKVQLSFKF